MPDHRTARERNAQVIDAVARQYISEEMAARRKAADAAPNGRAHTIAAMAHAVVSNIRTQPARALDAQAGAYAIHTERSPVDRIAVDERALDLHRRMRERADVTHCTVPVLGPDGATSWVLVQLPRGGR
jgi:hypothetical protein